jgi:hypothetical protein
MSVNDYKAGVASRGNFAGDSTAKGDTAQNHSPNKRAAAKTTVAEDHGTQHEPTAAYRPKPSDEPLRIRAERKE